MIDPSLVQAKGSLGALTPPQPIPRRDSSSAHPQVVPSARHSGRPSLFADRRGLSTVEYVIILLLIAVFSLVAWQQLGRTLRGRVKQSTGAISSIRADDTLAGSR